MDKSLERLAVEIEPGILDVSEDEEKRIKWEIAERYRRAYELLEKEYAKYIVPGTGYKTNKYGEAKMNLAYNYIQHPNFHGIAEERGNRYPYWRPLYAVACDRVCADINRYIPDDVMPWRLRLDHSGDKREDFQGLLILYKNPVWWHRRNGYEDMRP